MAGRYNVEEDIGCERCDSIRPLQQLERVVPWFSYMGYMHSWERREKSVANWAVAVCMQRLLSSGASRVEAAVYAHIVYAAVHVQCRYLRMVLTVVAKYVGFLDGMPNGQ